ncbi:hypothetical protein PISMIDRAFT_683333 [Pisolithus microcarpus 441]|uniref:Uncharacterized protein n=1 Tax=Pisolithus microcarpus 441 TaxID=765257 RepID=A0A0C9Y2J7_9AGAM|nr:hypothetical protein PISMIDRAFT_683605 [Pisolithus microcarpus 441]KIK19350.1 hypothetical protein PISMIDRAFT_683333 [Pisolithus microcarpus 441]
MAKLQSAGFAPRVYDAWATIHPLKQSLLKPPEFIYVISVPYALVTSNLCRVVI